MADDKYAPLYFRMNFFILEAMYEQLIEAINKAYPNARVSNKDKDLFYVEMMRSNRYDYSKYKNGSSGKTRITSTMKEKLLRDCPELTKYLVGCELLKVGQINGEWARKRLGSESTTNDENTPAKILKDCKAEVCQLMTNIVEQTKDSFNTGVDEDDHKISLWMCKYIIDNWVETTGAELKIEDKLKELETINFDIIDRCSIKRLEDYYNRISDIYEIFRKVYEYKALKKDNK